MSPSLTVYDDSRQCAASMGNATSKQIMTRELRPSRTESFEFTITGLLAKRQEMVTEAERLRERVAEIKNDLRALDRILELLEYKGDLDGMSPKEYRKPLFERRELTKLVLDAMRTAGKPMMSRDIAIAVATACGDDPKDRRYISDLTRRVGRALTPLLTGGAIQASADNHGTRIWRVA